MDLRQLRALGAALIRAMRGYGLFGRIGATGSAATFAGPCRIGCGAGEVAIVAAMQRRSEASGVGLASFCRFPRLGLFCRFPSVALVGRFPPGGFVSAKM